jgi:hypothetical protein
VSSPRPNCSVTSTFAAVRCAERSTRSPRTPRLGHSRAPIATTACCSECLSAACHCTSLSTPPRSDSSSPPPASSRDRVGNERDGLCQRSSPWPERSRSDRGTRRPLWVDGDHGVPDRGESPCWRDPHPFRLLRSTPAAPPVGRTTFETIGFVRNLCGTSLRLSRERWTLNGAASLPTFFAATTTGGFYSHVSLKPATLTQVSGRCPAALWSGARSLLVVNESVGRWHPDSHRVGRSSDAKLS